MLLDLVALGINRIRIGYNGSGDSGSVDSILGYKGDNEVELNETIAEWAENTMFDKLPGGWEINEGSQGVATIYVYEHRIEIEHEENVMSTVDLKIEEELSVSDEFGEQLTGHLMPGRDKPKKKGKRKDG